VAFYFVPPENVFSAKLRFGKVGINFSSRSVQGFALDLAQVAVASFQISAYEPAMGLLKRLLI